MKAPRTWATVLLDSLLLAILTVGMVWPLFRIKYVETWSSIESTFISDARFLKEHWPHPQWQPLWYGGTRFDYIYPPALRYGTAGLSKIFPIIPARAYHMYVALFYCLGIAGVYLLIWTGTRSRGAAWLGAVAAGLLSPCYLFMGHIRAGGLHIAPWRLTVLVVYGEGPHMSALALLGFALAACWVALQKRRPAMLALAAVLCALVVSHNFYGAVALAMFFPIMCWSLWITRQDKRIWFRALGIAGLAYGLTAFWLVPSYFQVTMANLKLVSSEGNLWSLWIAVAVAVGFVLATDKLARGRPERAYPVFVIGSFVFFALNVLGQHYFKFRVVGEPERLAPEFDLVAILIAIEGLRRLWAGRLPQRVAWLKARPWLIKGLAVGLVLAAFLGGRHYFKHPWHFYRREGNFQQRVEYRIPDWIWKNLPEGRSLVTGSVRFWYNTWHDVAQIGGGSEQGLRNPVVIPAFWQIMLGDTAEPSIQWMQCLGVDAVVVHDKNSQEVYHDFQFPKKFAGVLPVLFDDQQGNVIYRVPRRFRSLARVVDRARAAALKPFAREEEAEFIRVYAQLVENGPETPAALSWEGTEAMRVRARLKPGEAVLVQEAWDPAWRAYSQGRPVPIRRDALGQMLVEAPPGEQELRLVFETPLENYVGRIVSVVCGVLVLVLVGLGYRAKEVRA